MNYLEAIQQLEICKPQSSTTIQLMMSGEAAPLSIYLRAAFARQQVELALNTLPFGTLHQALAEPQDQSAPMNSAVILICPWDFCPALDWRRGGPAGPFCLANAETQMAEFLAQLAARNAALIFLPAAVPKAFHRSAEAQYLVSMMAANIQLLGGQVLPSEWFCLSTYLRTGTVIGGRWLGEFALKVADHCLAKHSSPKKLLLTDLDNVLWRGVLAEDGLTGVQCGHAEEGFIHYIYQKFLLTLVSQGVVVAAVSRNDESLVRSALRSELTPLSEEDFVWISASYGSKSGQITQLLGRLNLSASHAVFVDDNPLELKEVELAIPEISVIQFPDQDHHFAGFMDQLALQFERTPDEQVTAEDLSRTELYRTQLAGLKTQPKKGADLSAYLRSLQMRLHITEPDIAQTGRVIQLVNKTNQFNLNGRLLTCEQLQTTLNEGSRVFAATLEDRHGSHGEIAACVVTPDLLVTTLVVSCRVLQRRIEHALTTWLAGLEDCSPLVFDLIDTGKNTPAITFFQSPFFAQTSSEGVQLLDHGSLRREADPVTNISTITHG